MSINTASAYSVGSRHRSAIADAPLAEVLSIESAPSLKRRKVTLRAEDPAMHRRPLMAKQPILPVRRRVIRGVVGTMLILVAGAAGVGAGIAAQPDAYAGPTTSYIVGAGESIWSIAQAMNVDRPISDVVFDIQQMNNIDGGLWAGQSIVLPLE